MMGGGSVNRSGISNLNKASTLRYSLTEYQIMNNMKTGAKDYQRYFAKDEEKLQSEEKISESEVKPLE